MVEVAPLCCWWPLHVFSILTQLARPSWVAGKSPVYLGQWGSFPLSCNKSLSLYMKNHQVVHGATRMQSFPSRCCIHQKVLKIHGGLTSSAFIYGCKYFMIHCLMYLGASGEFVSILRCCDIWKFPRWALYT